MVFLKQGMTSFPGCQGATPTTEAQDARLLMTLPVPNSLCPNLHPRLQANSPAVFTPELLHNLLSFAHTISSAYNVLPYLSLLSQLLLMFPDLSLCVLQPLPLNLL